jgi:selenocysteine lyase/cysteine desulfurase
VPTRRQLLAGGAALALAGCGSSKRPHRERAGDSPPGWPALKTSWDLPADEHHFDAFVLAPHPEPVRRAIARHRAGLDAGAAEYLHAHQERLESEVNDEASRYLGVSKDLGVPSDDIAYTDSTTMGLGLVYRALGPGTEVLTTEHDFYATHEALRLSGPKVERVALYDDPARATADEMLSRLKAAITPRTEVLALTWVHSGTGVKIPAREILKLGPRVVLDSVHALAVEDEDADQVSDVFVAGTHKWLGGPRGTGVVWSREPLAATIPTFSMVDTPGARFTPGGYHSFEHRWALADAFRWLGRAEASERIRALATRLKDGLADLPHVRLVTPRDPLVSAGIVCFDVDGQSAQETVDALRRKKIRASVTPYAVTHVRLGCSLHVLEEDVDAAVEGVKALRG